MTDSSQPALAAILSELINQPVAEQQINPLLAYLGALSGVLLGVQYADQQITEAERQRFSKTLTEFIPEGSSLNSVMRSLVQGVRDSKIYAKPAEIAKLTSLFDESEKLLLLALGYEMATADGDLNPKEQKYLHIIAQHLDLKDEWLAAVEVGLVDRQKSEALNEVRYMLDPARFQSLDPVFARAAGQILAQFPDCTKSHGTNTQAILNHYENLAEFQAKRQQLDHLCGKLFQLVWECEARTPLLQHLATDLQKISQKLQSQRFRVAVVGEFSQGKSTMLNALLGEEIQPTRVIPCSGSITVLRYGEQKQVMCRYRNGREEIIPLEEYQHRASIPDDAALGNRADALASDVLEIVYEHPGLELCRHGVELIDSPGLNEHPERTRITDQLLENVDAVIFLANGLQPMTQGEREILNSLKLKLNGGQDDRPANNLFVLVNFMDLVRRERDLQQVRQLVENSVFGEFPIIENPKQLHFISAQAALDAIIDGDAHSEYLQSFRAFTQILETFLTQERGMLVNQRVATDLQGVVQALTLQLTQAEKVNAGKISISDAAKQDLLNKIGEASGCLANLQTLIQLTSEQARNVVQQLLIKQYLEASIQQKSADWVSDQGSTNKILQEFGDEFQSNLSDSINEWVQIVVAQDTLGPPLNLVDTNIQSKIFHFQKDAKEIDLATGSQLVAQLDLSLSQVAPQFKFQAATDSEIGEATRDIGIGVIGGLGAGGILVGGVALAISSIAFFPLVLTGGAIAGVAAAGAALGTAIGGTIGFFKPPDQEAIKQKVIADMFKQFYDQDGIGKLMTSIDIEVKKLFDQRLRTIRTITRQYIDSLNSLLVDWETAHTLALNKVEAECQWYQEQHGKLTTLQSQLNDCLA